MALLVVHDIKADFEIAWFPADTALLDHAAQTELLAIRCLPGNRLGGRVEIQEVFLKRAQGQPYRNCDTGHEQPDQYHSLSARSHVFPTISARLSDQPELQTFPGLTQLPAGRQHDINTSTMVVMPKDDHTYLA